MEPSKKKKIILIVVIVALVAVALYLWWKKKQNVEVAQDIVVPSTDSGTVQNVSAPKATTSVVAKKPTFPLKAGSSGKEVKQLQAYLLKQGYQFPKYGVDGNWGKTSTETTDNVKRGLKVSEVSEGLFKKLGIDKIKV